MGHATTAGVDLQPGPATRWEWMRQMWEHRAILGILSRKDFQVRYKRATLGVLWAVAVPVLQGVVFTVVFSRFVPVEGDISYGVYVLAGILPWAYFSASLTLGSTSIVEGASLTDKIWFPRAILPLVVCGGGLVGLGISMGVLVAVMPLMGVDVTPRLALLVPACALLIAFTSTLSVVVAALQVYFRDVRFLVSAALLVWLYATPVLYQPSALGDLEQWLDLNPLTGIVQLFHVATVGDTGAITPAVAVSVLITAVLGVIGLEIHRRHDRLFVDLL